MVYMLLCKIHCLEIYINVSSIHFSVPYRISWKRTQRKHSHVLLTGKLQQIKGLQLRWVSCWLSHLEIFYQFLLLLLSVYLFITRLFPKVALESQHHPLAWGPEYFSLGGQWGHLQINHPFVPTGGLISIGRDRWYLLSVSRMVGYLNYFCPPPFKKKILVMIPLIIDFIDTILTKS